MKYLGKLLNIHFVFVKNNLKLIFSGKNQTFNDSHLEEEQYYKHFLKEYDYTIIPKKIITVLLKMLLKVN